MTKRSV